MLYLIDTSNIKEIQQAMDVFPIAGVTTNPALIAKEKAKFPDVLCEIHDIIGSDSMLHAQVLGQTFEAMVQDAYDMIKACGDKLYIKVPVVAAGIKAIKQLHKDGIRTTATAVFTPQQALLAAVAGADFIAPYVNRLDNICGNGANVVSEIVQLFRIHQLPTRVLSASFKNIEQVHRVSLAGSHAVTVSSDILGQLLAHPMTEIGIAQFTTEWESVYGVNMK